METPDRTQKKRPPPMELRLTHPGQAVPGPNAFAMAEQRKQEEFETEPLQRYELADCSSDSESSPSLRLSTTARSRLSNKEAYSNLANGVLRSPKKSRQSYASSTAPSRHSSTIQSKQPERSYSSSAATQMRAEGFGEEPTATVRDAIEAQNETKYIKMMGQAPETPIANAIPRTNVKVTDMRQSHKSDSTRDSDCQDSVTKSAKKKLWGLNIPFTTRPPPKVTVPPMPLKAAKLMGETPPARAKKYLPMARMLRSDTANSLPGTSKLFNQPDHHGHRRSPPQERRRSPAHEEAKPLSRAHRRSPPSQPTVFSNKKTLIALTGSDKLDSPPIPPRKDSLSYFLQNSGFRHQEEAEDVEYAGCATPEALKPVKKLLVPPTPQVEPDDITDSGMQMFAPSVFRLDAVPQDIAEDTEEVHHTSGLHKTRVVEGFQIVSSYATVRYSMTGESEPSSRSAPLRSPDRGPLSSLRGDRQSAPPTPTVPSRSRSQSPELEYLKPTVYVPPKKEVKKPNLLQRDSDSDGRADRAVQESIPIVFQGQLSEVDSDSVLASTIRKADEVRKQLSSETHNGARGSSVTQRGMEKLRIIHPDEVHESAQDTGRSNAQSEQSSSRLTDILNGTSPSTMEFREFGNPSAVPSPLHRTLPPSQPGPGALGPGQQHPPSYAPFTQQPFSPDAPMVDHLYMLNKHIEVVALTLYDWIGSRQESALRAASSWHGQLHNIVEQQFNDIKSKIDSVSDKENENGNQCHNLSVQLAQLRDFIKTEVAEVLAKQSQKTNEMENSMRELQKTMQDLRMSIAQRTSPSLPASSPPRQSFLPNPRSQPNLPAFFDPTGVTNGFATPGLPGPPGLGRYGVNPQSGRQTFLREGRENAANANMYQAAGISPNNGYGAGDYPQTLFNGYYSMHDQPQPHGYGQGPQK